MSQAEQVQIASLELQLGKYDKDQKQSSLVALKFEADMLERRIERLISIAERRPEYFEKVEQVEAELDEIRDAMVEIRKSNVSEVKRCRSFIATTSQQEEEADKPTEEDEVEDEVLVLETSTTAAVAGDTQSSSE